MMDYDKLRAEQAALRRKNIHRGIGIAVSSRSPIPARRSTASAARKSRRRMASRCGWMPQANHLPDQHHRAGPGLGIAHRADRRQRARRLDGTRARHPRRHRQHALWRRHLGVARRRHRGRPHFRRRRFCVKTSWRSGGHPAVVAGRLDIADNAIVNANDGAPRIELRELARIVYFRPDTLPPASSPN